MMKFHLFFHVFLDCFVILFLAMTILCYCEGNEAIYLYCFYFGLPRCLWLFVMTSFRHCERSEVIHRVLLFGLPRRLQLLAMTVYTSSFICWSSVFLGSFFSVGFLSWLARSTRLGQAITRPL